MSTDGPSEKELLVHEGPWTAGPPTGKINKDQLLQRLEVLGIPRDEYADPQLNILLDLVNGYTPLSLRITRISFPEEFTPLQQAYRRTLIPNKRRNDE